MRAGVRVGRVGVSGRVPGPSGVANGLGGLAEATGLLLVAAFWLVVAVLWLIKKAAIIIVALLIGITAPIWWPIRGWARHHRKVEDRKAVDRVRRMQAAGRFTQPPTGPRVAP